jgi:hypothetical protein
VDFRLLYVKSGKCGDSAKQVGRKQNALTANSHERYIECAHVLKDFTGKRLDRTLNRKLWIEFAELGLDALLERHHSIRTAAAVSNEAERDRLAFHADEFHIATVLLEHGTERIKHCLNLFFERHFLSPKIEKRLNYTKRPSISQELEETAWHRYPKINIAIAALHLN